MFVGLTFTSVDRCAVYRHDIFKHVFFLKNFGLYFINPYNADLYYLQALLATYTLFYPFFRKHRCDPTILAIYNYFKIRTISSCMYLNQTFTYSKWLQKS